MEELIPKYYKQYADYTNKEKMLPNMVDGLIPVQRRMLLTLHLTANGSYVKTAQALGTLMGRFHPHAEAMSSAVVLVSNKFADGLGSWGTSIGIEPIDAAAPRYTKIKSNTLIESIAFKYINDVPWVESESENEPKILPTAFPFCLFGANEFSSIAFGFKAEIPTYELKDLKSRLLWLLNKDGKEPIIKPKYYNCSVLSTNKELKELLINGTGKIDICGKYTEDIKNKRIYIHGWSPRYGFQTILNKINKYKGYKLLDSGNIGFIDESTESVGTNIRLEVLKNRNTDDIYDKLKNAVIDALKATISYNIYVTDGESVKIVSVDNMLLKAYYHYMESFKNHCENKIKSYDDIIKEYNVINKIKPYVSKATQCNTYDEMILYLVSKSSENKDDISNIIEKYKIKKLLTISPDINNIKLKLKDYKDKLKNSDSSVLDEYNSFEI